MAMIRQRWLAWRIGPDIVCFTPETVTPTGNDADNKTADKYQQMGA